jgi:UDP-N-acetylmuramate--alanine ligase
MPPTPWRARRWPCSANEIATNALISPFPLGKGARGLGYLNALAKHIYFLGIAGIGVSALAQVALARGSCVSGADPSADPAANPAVARLAAGGATLYCRHEAANLAPDVDLVVASAAVPESNPEMREARQRGLRMVSRAEFLGELMAAHKGVTVAVAGTHGKTTTTAMIGVMLQHLGLDPTVFVGGEVAQLGGNVRIGSETGPFIAEACEAYDSFLSMHPDIAVLTNIEADHLDHYGSYERVQESFVRFLRNVRRRGNGLVLCGDDPGIQAILPELAGQAPYLAYGIDGVGLQSAAENVRLTPHPAFDWIYDGRQVRIELSVPGRHNALNALAAATLGAILDPAHPLPMAETAAGLATFRGATRRQELLGSVGRGEDSILVMDDYAHHPTEIVATLDALRAAHPKRRLVVAFQPHLYSRTRDFLPQFAAALALADVAVVTDIYAAREEPLPGVSAEQIVRRLVNEHGRPNTIYTPDKWELPNTLLKIGRGGDMTVFMGAGDIRLQGERYVELLRQHEERS